MAYDLEWDHYFCLTCDKQTTGDAYCSESCRMIDYEQAACNVASPVEPCYPPEGTISYLWKDAAPNRYDRQLFDAPGRPFGYYYPSNYNNHHHHAPAPQRHASTGNAQASTATANPTASMLGRGGATTSVTYAHALSPSSSHSSLSSMQSGLSGAGRASNFGGGAMDALSAFAYGSMRNSYSSTRPSTTTGSSRLDQARSELRKYASSLEQGKLQRDLQRRRSC